MRCLEILKNSSKTYQTSVLTFLRVTVFKQVPTCERSAINIGRNKVKFLLGLCHSSKTYLIFSFISYSLTRDVNELANDNKFLLGILLFVFLGGFFVKL